MTSLVSERIVLSTGVSLNTCLAGPEDGEPILFLHGFPESHRTWRHQIRDLSRDCRVIAPDQRGFGASDKPQGVEAYAAECAVGDAIALADALGIGRFTLIGHDWGGAIAWLAALRHPDRVKRLVVVNAPHPLLFQRSLIEDEAQRAASQYINLFRSPAAETAIAAMGLETFLDKVLLNHADASKLEPEERHAYLDDWRKPGALTPMLNWYRAARFDVPRPGEEAGLPLWTRAPFPHVTMPTLVLWGLGDSALLPIQLEGLDDLVDDLRILTSPTASHFVTWEEPDFVTGAIRKFIAES